MEPKSDVTVLITGAGPTGLTLAVELARRDVSLRLVDRLPEPLAWERATEIHARGMEIFEQQGIVGRFVERGIHCGRIAFYTGGRLIGATSLTGIESNYPFDLAIDEPATERFLTERLLELGGAVQRDTEVVGLAQNADRAEVRLRHASADEETITADWVVGCGGAHSIVRHALKDTFDGFEYPRFPIAIDAEFRNWPLPPNEFAVVLGPDNFGSQPLPEGLRRIWWDLETDHDPAPDEVNAVIERNVGPGVVVGREQGRSRFRLHNRICKRFRRGRLFVAGDAAHICSPLGGHGMNAGMQDAYNLAWKLAAVVAGGPESLLDSYDAERRPVVERLLEADRQMMESAQTTDPKRAYQRDRAIAIQAADPVGHGAMALQISELGIGYRNSPIVESHRASDGEWLGLVPGDRVPDVRLTAPDASSTSVHRLLRGTGHMVLVFSGHDFRPAVDVWLALRADAGADRHVELVVPDNVPIDGVRDAGQALIDNDWSVHNRFGVVGCELFAIRPDGYLGFRSDGPDRAALDAYLAKVSPRRSP